MRSGVIDRDNLVAVAWGALYSIFAVLTIGALDRLGIPPTITVPVVVIVLPILIGCLLALIERWLDWRADG
jgi:hypothetical protein